jgi:hypothetical protein
VLGISVNDPRDWKELSSGLVGCAVTRRFWSPLIVEIVEDAKWINSSSLKRKKIFGLPNEPGTMDKIKCESDERTY